MIVLIDGPDNVGKTTVINKLHESTGYPIIKMPNMKEYFEKGLTEEFSKLFNETIVQFRKFSFILDRGFTSSLVYSKVYNRSFDLSYLKDIQEQLNPVVIILHNTDSNGKNIRFQDDDIDAINSKYDEIVDTYKFLAKALRYNLINVNGLSPDEVEEKILDVIRNSQ